jgi:hypothetical protein
MTGSEKPVVGGRPWSITAVDSVCPKIWVEIRSHYAEVAPRFTPNVIARPAISSRLELN